MEALRWALDNTITSSSTLLFLIHVFPETRFIPYPCLGEANEGQSESRTSGNLYVSGKGEEKNSVA
jgi:hypothetical protein